MNHPETAKSMAILAIVEAGAGDPAAAEHARTALSLLRASLGDDHPLTKGQAPYLMKIAGMVSGDMDRN